MGGNRSGAVGHSTRSRGHLSATAPTHVMKWLTVQQLKSRSPQTRRQAVEKLAAEQSAQAVKYLLPFVTDPEPGVRRAVIQALGRIKDEQGLTPLMNALRDPDSEVREAAVVSLTQ